MSLVASAQGLTLSLALRAETWFCVFSSCQAECELFDDVVKTMLCKAFSGHLGVLWAQRAACSALLPPRLLQDAAKTR